MKIDEMKETTIDTRLQILPVDNSDRFSLSTLFPVLVTIIALLCGIVAVFAPSIVSKVLPALSATQVLAYSSWGFIIGTTITAIIVILRRDELAATLIIAIQLYIDSYLGFHFASQIMALVLLVIFYLARSPQHPWIEPRALWLWGLFLVLAILPAIQGATNLFDAAFYYPNIIFGALAMFWLGTVISRDSASMRRLFKMLAGFGTLIAIHTIIQAVTGTYLFATQSEEAFLAGVANYQLTGSDAHRAGSFFIDPNWNGAFFAMMLFISLGLFFKSSSVPGKVLYLTEMFLMLLALLFTYSTGAWIAACAGFIVFVIFVGHAHSRVILVLFLAVATTVLIVGFPSQVALLLQHASNPSEVLLRIGAWQTGLRVIAAFPLTGVGLGLQAYRARADPYRVPAQYVPLVHPHDSYLELGAMAGLPVLIVFVALLLFALLQALHNWIRADVRTRSLLGGGIAAVVAVSINSLSINGWTLPPLAALGWMIAGTISSPLISRKFNCQVAEERNLLSV
jgi:O-antigen ligase